LFLKKNWQALDQKAALNPTDVNGRKLWAKGDGSTKEVPDVIEKKTPVLQAFLGEYQKLPTKLADSLGIFLHHDAITGTSKSAVYADYYKRMNSDL
jgi:hypothetical protein